MRRSRRQNTVLCGCTCCCRNAAARKRGLRIDPGVLRMPSASAGPKTATRLPDFRSRTTPTAGEFRSAEESAPCAVGSAAPIEGETNNSVATSTLRLQREPWVPHIPDFLRGSVASMNFMRPSLTKGAHAVLSRAACRKFGVSRSFFARCGIPQSQTSNSPDPNNADLTGRVPHVRQSVLRISCRAFWRWRTSCGFP